MWRIKVVTKDGYPNIDRSINLEDGKAADAFCRQILKNGVKADVSFRSTLDKDEIHDKFYFIPKEGIHYLIMEK